MAEAWETLVGNAFVNAFFSSSNSQFILGIFFILAVVWYCFSFGLSSEVVILAVGLLIIYLGNFGILPVALPVSIVLIAGLYIYKAVSQVPNG